jgi:uroporphyrinogen decarboxylase
MMGKLTSKERVLLALNHEETDRVPVDFGGTIATTIVLPAYEKLKKLLGFEHETKIRAARAQTVIPDESVLEYFKVDTRPLVLGDFSGQKARKINKNAFVDAWGVIWKKAEDGHYINVDGPFQEGEPGISALENHTWPDPDDSALYQGLKEHAEFLRKNTDCAIVLGLPLGVIHQSQFLRGFAEWLMDLAGDPEFAEGLMDRICDIWCRIAQNALEAVGKNVDVVEWGDDVAMQDSLLFSQNTYRKQIKPYHQKMINTINSRSEAKVLFHSCGAVFPLIEDFIDNGVDALNPVQVSAKGMEPVQLKEKFGDLITFWGGIDTQYVLPKGTPESVKEEVRRIIEELGKGGGFVLASVHNIQADVPTENVVAMFEEAGKIKWR